MPIRVEIWSDLAAAGGVRLAFAADGDVLSASDARELGGAETLTLTLRRDSAAWGQVEERRVVRVVHTDTGAAGEVEEWTISEVGDTRDEEDATWGTLVAEAPLTALADADPVVRVEADGRVTLDFDLLGLTPAEHLGVILAGLPAYIQAGVVEPTQAVDVTYDGLSPLAALLGLAEAAGGEIEYERDGDVRYLVHLRAERGSAAAEASLAYARNLVGLSRTRAVAPMATRVYPTGASEDGFASTTGGAAWEVGSVAGAVLTLLGGPVRWDGQLDGLYAESLSSGARSLILSTSAAAQAVTLASAAGFAAGDLVAVRSDAAGTELLYVDRPSPYAARGPKVRRLERSDIPAIDNLAPNPYLDQWSGAVLQGWHGVGASGQMLQETSPLYRRHGGASAHVITTAPGGGLESDWVRVVPTAARPYLTAQVALWVASGAVRLEVDVEEADGGVTTYPRPNEGAAYTSKTGTWVEDLDVHGIDLWGTAGRRVRLRLMNHAGAACEFYLDAAQVVQEAERASVFWSGRAGNDLWIAALDWLDAHGEPEVRYEVGVVDLERVDPAAFAFDRLVLGGTVRVRDTDLSVDVRTRVVRLERDLLTPGDTRVSLATLPQALSRQMAHVPPRPPRGSTAAPGAGVPAEILEVTVSGATTATVRVRANAATRALWRERESTPGVWGERAKIADAAEGSFQVERPATGEDLYRVAGEDSGGALGPWREVPVAAPQEIPDAATRPDLYAKWWPGSALDTADVQGLVRDSFGAEVTLSVWVNHDDYDSPDPDAPADGSVVLTGTPMVFGPATVFGAAGALLNEIKSHPAEPKTIYLEAVAPDGRSTGRVSLPISSRLEGLVNELGELEAGSILRWSQFAEKYQPPLLFATEAAMRAATGIEAGRRAVTQDTGSEWAYRSGAWVAEAFPRSEGFYPVFVAGAVRAAYFHSDVGDFVDVRANQAAFDTVYAETLNALQANITTLSEIVPGMGVIVNGKLQNAAATTILDLNASGTQSMLKAGSWLDIKAGSASFTGQVIVNAGTNFASGYDPSTKETPTGAQAKANAAQSNANAYTDAAIAGSGANVAAVVIRSATAPATRPGGAALKAGDVWLESDNGDLPSTWSGSVWVRMYTKIDGGLLTTGSVDASKLTALQLTVGQYIRSTTYTAGSIGWKINADGTAELNNVTVRGTVYATAGEFSGEVKAGAIVSASQFTAPAAHFTGAIEVDGSVNADLGMSVGVDQNVLFNGTGGVRFNSNNWKINVSGGNLLFSGSSGIGFYMENYLAPNVADAFALHGNWVSASDRRLKTDLSPRTGSLARVRAIQPQTFQRGNRAEVGFSAQDVAAVFPEAVFDMGTVDGIPHVLGLSAMPLVAELWGAFRELTDRLDARFPGLLA